MIRYLIAFAVALGSLHAGAAQAAAGPPKVVASIKPLHSLVAGVMGGVGEPYLLIQGAGSPHSYSLRPSEARALEQADLVVWVGPGLETFLQKPLQALAGKARVVELHEAEGVALLDLRAGGAWEPHHHGDEDHDEQTEEDHEHEEHEHDDHEHGSHDLHIWLDPGNAAAIVRAVQAALSDLDPGNAARYGENAAGLEAKIAALDGELADSLAAVKDRPFIVFHDGYHYLEHHYGLNGAGSITLEPDRAPGARRLAELRQRIAELGAVCVFSEPQFEPALVETLIAGLPVKTGVLDPLGAALPEGAEAYFTLMRNLGTSLTSCLEAGS